MWEAARGSVAGTRDRAVQVGRAGPSRLRGACGQAHGGRGREVVGWVDWLDHWLQLMDPRSITLSDE
jgi:hypothetical protein